MTARRAIAVLGGLVLVAMAFWYAQRPGGDVSGEIDLATLTIPDLTEDQASGKALFDRNCAACHGANANGSDQGPPLVHRVYEPSHHGDMAFLLAATRGVRAHHWRFGNMPAVEGVTNDDAAKITAYVRALQRANGIN
ncbi:mono/diheme cytochrome c family protein [Rhodovulum iodosum]|uniref:Mono/diheme cytochrome c family protein n=2 Tax=Rhodovulum iodosum TaxID=68291 RepID=A0ABV3XTH6_9RHOB